MSTQQPVEGREAEATLDLDRARSLLARVWFIGSALPFGVLMIQSILGRYYNPLTKISQLDEVWSWFIPTVVPTLSLLTGIIGASALGQQDERKVRKTFLDLTLWLSATYLAVLSLTIFLEPFSPYEGADFFKITNFWITPIQGLTIAATGFLFSSSSPKQSIA